MLTIKNFKSKMEEKAKKKGCIWENFGQKEISKLKDKYKYNQYANQWSDTKELSTKNAIDELDRWTMSYNI